MIINHRQKATILAALDLWQSQKRLSSGHLTMSTDGGAFTKLNSSEIEDLIEILEMESIEQKSELNQSELNAYETVLDEDFSDQLMDLGGDLGDHVAGMIENSAEREILATGGLVDISDSGLGAATQAYLIGILESLGFQALDRWPGVNIGHLVGAFNEAMNSIIEYSNDFPHDSGDEGESEGLSDEQIQASLITLFAEAKNSGETRIGDVVANVKVEVSATGAVRIGFLTPDDYASCVDDDDESLELSYEHWITQRLRRVISCLESIETSKSKFRDLKLSGVDLVRRMEFFSLRELLESGRPGKSLDKVYLEFSHHGVSEEAISKATACQASIINGEDVTICICMAFLNERMEPCGQVNLFPLEALYKPRLEAETEATTIERVESAEAFCEKYAHEMNCSFSRIGNFDFEMCQTHKQLIARYREKGDSQSSAPGKIH
jgi:hypothetical protein